MDYYGVQRDDVFLLTVTINFDPFIMQVGGLSWAKSWCSTECQQLGM